MTTDKSSIHGRMEGSPKRSRKVTAEVNFRSITIKLEDLMNRSNTELKALIIRRAVEELTDAEAFITWLQVEEI